MDRLFLVYIYEHMCLHISHRSERELFSKANFRLKYTRISTKGLLQYSPVRYRTNTDYTSEIVRSQYP
jgi:hypothetical protein